MTNPFRTGPAGLVVGFLADIHPLSFVATMAGKQTQALFGVKATVCCIVGRKCSRRWRCLRGNKNENDPASRTPVHLRDPQLVSCKVEDMQYCKMS